MKARKCDVCGTFYECYSRNVKFKNCEVKVNGFVLIERDIRDERYYTKQSIDLCPGCMKKVEDLIQNL